MAATNPFLSTQKSSDSSPAVLHPLVLLSISDHITRHTLRKQPGPIAGGLLGQQNGHEVTLEHTFDFSVLPNNQGGVQLDQAWFSDRLCQMRTVHKDRMLDLVGWYTVLSRSGPTPEVLQIHEQILSMCGDSSAAVLLAFHPEDLDEPSVGGRLPLTIYETSYEPDEDGAVAAARRIPGTGAPPGGEDKEMEDAGESAAGGPSAQPAATQMTIKFREIPYTVETEEAEMISIDFVAGGVANASADTKAAPGTSAASSSAASGSAGTSSNSRDRAVAVESGNRGKRRLVVADSAGKSGGAAATDAAAAPLGSGAGNGLSVEDEETIAALTTRANAIRMLHGRLRLLSKYLESLPKEEDGGAATGVDGVAVSQPILRSIQALVHRLPLVVPPPVNGAFEEEQQREANDVELMSLLLDDMMQSIGAVRQTGVKFGVVETARVSRQRALAGNLMGDFGPMGGMGGSNNGASSFDMLL